MKAIAVSRDLIALRLTHGAKVKIDGLSGTCTVRDKLDKPWKHRIDIYLAMMPRQPNSGENIK